jgi:hypothetical protein
MTATLRVPGDPPSARESGRAEISMKRAKMVSRRHPLVRYGFMRGRHLLLAVPSAMSQYHPCGCMGAPFSRRRRLLHRGRSHIAACLCLGRRRSSARGTSFRKSWRRRACAAAGRYGAALWRTSLASSARGWMTPCPDRRRLSAPRAGGRACVPIICSRWKSGAGHCRGRSVRARLRWLRGSGTVRPGEAPP